MCSSVFILWRYMYVCLCVRELQTTMCELGTFNIVLFLWHFKNAFLTFLSPSYAPVSPLPTVLISNQRHSIIIIYWWIPKSNSSTDRYCEGKYYAYGKIRICIVLFSDLDSFTNKWLQNGEIWKITQKCFIFCISNWANMPKVIAFEPQWHFPKNIKNDIFSKSVYFSFPLGHFQHTCTCWLFCLYAKKWFVFKMILLIQCATIMLKPYNGGIIFFVVLQICYFLDECW